jgi:hypothetical protein
VSKQKYLTAVMALALLVLLAAALFSGPVLA